MDKIYLDVARNSEPAGGTYLEWPASRTVVTYPPETRFYIDPALGEIDTPAEVVRLPLTETAKTVHRLAIGAMGLGAVLATQRLYPREAFETAARRLQKAKVADTNITGFAAGFDLMG